MNETTEKDWLAKVLTRDIPLGQAMALSIASLDEQRLVFELPLAPNVNDKGTAFGGAMASAMILAGWSLPRLLLRRHHQVADLVVSRCEINFIRPVNGPFEVICDWPEPAACEVFIADLADKQHGRLALQPRVVIDGEVAATLTARYAALQRA